MNIYKSCPSFYTDFFTVRLIRAEDAPGLLKVYSDKSAQPYFNADNCTSDFRYTTLQEMQECVNMWLWSYEHGYFVRWCILFGGKPVGTAEMFRRDDGEDGKGCGVLRIDLMNRFEFTDVLEELLEAMLQPMHELFGCAEVLTKAPWFADQRKAALRKHGFVPARPQAGKNGAVFDDYWSHRA